MDKEIVIPRSKLKTVLYILFMLFATLLFLGACIHHWVGIPGLSISRPPFVLALMSAICAPITGFCIILYGKQLFNPNPILTVNAQGIWEQTRPNSVGMIAWSDIANIRVAPYAIHGNSLLIAIFLKNPQKYIQNEKELAKANRQAQKGEWGHVFLTTLYFEKQKDEVVALMRHYFEKSRAENGTFA